MTPQETIDDLKQYVTDRIYDNDQFLVSGTDIQESILKTIDDLFALIEAGAVVDLQDLQSVLIEGSIANISSAFDITAQGVNLILGSGGVNTTWSVGVPNSLKVGSSIIEMIADTGGTTAKLGVSPSGVSMEGSNSGSSGKVFVDAGTILIGGNNSTDGSVNIHGNAIASEGMGISRNITPPTNTALWDIDGDLRVRTIGDGSNDTEVLTTDVNGNIRKKTLQTDGLYTSTYADALVGQTTTPLHRYGYGTTGSGTAIIKLPPTFSTSDGFTFSCAAVNPSSVIEIRDQSDTLIRTLTSGQDLLLTKTYGGWFVQESL